VRERSDAASVGRYPFISIIFSPTFFDADMRACPAVRQATIPTKEIEIVLQPAEV
jgi:hypothetical protein